MVSCFGLIGDYSNKFHCAVGLDQYTYYDLIYQKNPTKEFCVLKILANAQVPQQAKI